jgi:hypothetical protein
MKKNSFIFVLSILVFLFSCQKSEKSDTSLINGISSITIEDATMSRIVEDIKNVSNAKSNLKSSVYYNLGVNLTPSYIYNAIPLKSSPYMGKFPSSYLLGFPPIGDQGSEGSCVAWATTYAGRSIKQHYDVGGTYSLSTNIYSPEYVYNQIKLGNCESGTYLYLGLDILVNKGACRWSVMPYTDLSCSTMPNLMQDQDALSNRISNYSRVSITVDAIKAQLISNHAVIVAGPVNQDFMDGKGLSTFNGSILGNHAYCIIGYLKVGIYEMFIFQNSWGASWDQLSGIMVCFNDGTKSTLRGCGAILTSNISTWVKEAYVLY